MAPWSGIASARPLTGGPLDVLLVNAYRLRDDRKWGRIEGPYAPLGPLYLAAALREAGIAVDYFDNAFQSSTAPFLRAMRVRRPRIVGIYTTIISSNGARELIALAKGAGTTVLVGGPDPTIQPELYLQAGADAVGMGEGERTIVESVQALLQGRDLEQVRGLALWRSGKVALTPPRERIADQDSIPFPARDLMPWDDYATMTRSQHGHSLLSVLTSRGCPHQCAWCAKPVFGNRYKARSVANVVTELLEVKESLRPDRIRIVDDVLTINRKRVLALCEGIESAGLDIPFECLSRVDQVDEEVLTALRNAGCTLIYFGVESGSQRVLDRMVKGISVGDVHRVMPLMKRLGLAAHWFLIYGYLGEELTDVQQTIDLVRTHDPESFSITLAYPLKGTPFYDEVAPTMKAEHWTTSHANRMMFDRRYGRAFYRGSILATHLAARSSRLARRHPGALSTALDSSVRSSSAALLRLLAKEA